MRKHPCILVGIDPEGAAVDALAQARLLAPLFDAELHALLVREEDEAQAFPRPTAIPADQTLIERSGSAVEKIGEAVREFAVSLLVLGPHQAGRRDSVLGGTARRLLRGHPCPVLVHRGPGGSAYRRLLVAMDGSPEALGALRCARDWAREQDAELHVVDVFEPPDFVYEAGNPALPSYTVDAEGEEVHGERDQSLDAVNWQGVSVTRHRSEGDPVDEILRVADEIEADLLVLGGRRHTALETLVLGTTSDSVLRRTRASVLVV